MVQVRVHALLPRDVCPDNWHMSIGGICSGPGLLVANSIALNQREWAPDALCVHDDLPFSEAVPDMIQHILQVVEKGIRQSSRHLQWYAKLLQCRIYLLHGTGNYWLMSALTGVGGNLCSHMFHTFFPWKRPCCSYTDARAGIPTPSCTIGKPRRSGKKIT